MMQRWYVARVKTQMLVTALRGLRDQGFDTMQPSIREVVRGAKRGKPATRICPLFPGFLFVGFDSELDRWQPINNTRGIRGLLTFANGQPAPLSRKEVEWLKGFVEARELSEAELLLQEFRTGQPIRLLDGPFEGHVGTCKAVQSKAITVLLQILGQVTPVIVPVNSVQAI